MSKRDTVTAADIARMGNVRRAAVSNWRRRYPDFPRPVGGTAASPLFELAEIQDWLRSQGKTFELPLTERAWQRLRGSADDLRLGQLVARTGALLLADSRAETDNSAEPIDPVLRELVLTLAAERGHPAAFDFLVTRYLDAHSRRLSSTPPEIATLLARLSPPGGTVFDPACGFGGLLLAAEPDMALGQEITETAASIASTRLRLRGIGARVTTGDTLRADAFQGELADAVLCDPPFNEHAWGHAELTNDPRWEYGLPPRGEPELAWVQHCLGHVRPDGLVAILLPTAVAGRRAGKRIRGNLLRAGALRAVITLPGGGRDLWLLRKPNPGSKPSPHLLLLEPADLSEVEPAWLRFLDDPEATEAQRVVDLLDDDVDLSPARRLHAGGAQLATEFGAARMDLASTRPQPPAIAAREAPEALTYTTIGELLRSGQLSVHYAQSKTEAAETGALPMITADDLHADDPPSAAAPDDAELVIAEPGDVVAAPTGAVRVVHARAALGPYLARYRVDPERLDAEFLAGCLRAAGLRTPSGSSRMDTRRIAVPRLPVAEQRAYGAAFRGLTEFDSALRAAARHGETLVRLGFAGLIGGQLEPEHTDITW
ncbi:type I restriction-modification system DNA methylase subunit [Tamaricihabitans halophyticus]|uniref:Type I restriction-modification system DNA methylase subunit n=1 Tax=Tamaricihabitans halophyticus TaxID=1262583 RepID=A0A4V2SV17_9PSEU|nr:N-6 DNA methylase [Tamaricihabitans halophyticus]TCP56746.1 type I restriction-modification system DNA methylase subunit [Tamaricihabitans halophyticus]